MCVSLLSRSLFPPRVLFVPVIVYADAIALLAFAGLLFPRFPLFLVASSYVHPRLSHNHAHSLRCSLLLLADMKQPGRRFFDKEALYSLEYRSSHWEIE